MRSALTEPPGHPHPYYLSKTLAEREAWAFVEGRKPGFDLVAINPFLVVGPSLTPAINTSNQVLVDVLNGTFPGTVDQTILDTAADLVRWGHVAPPRPASAG